MSDIRHDDTISRRTHGSHTRPCSVTVFGIEKKIRKDYFVFGVRYLGDIKKEKKEDKKGGETLDEEDRRKKKKKKNQKERR